MFHKIGFNTLRKLALVVGLLFLSSSAFASVQIKITEANSDCDGSFLKIGNSSLDTIPAKVTGEIQNIETGGESLKINLKSPADDRVFEANKYTTDFVYVLSNGKAYGSVQPIQSDVQLKNYFFRGFERGLIYRFEEHIWNIFSDRNQVFAVDRVKECRLSVVVFNEYSSVEVLFHTHLLPKSWNRILISPPDYNHNQYFKPFGLVDEKIVLLQGNQLKLPKPPRPVEYNGNLGSAFGTYRFAIYRSGPLSAWRMDNLGDYELRLQSESANRNLSRLSKNRYICEATTGERVIEGPCTNRHNCDAIVPVFEINNCELNE